MLISCALSVAVNLHDCGVDHGVFHIGLTVYRIEGLLHTSALAQLRKRLKTVFHLLNSADKLRQGLPVHTIHSIL